MTDRERTEPADETERVLLRDVMRATGLPQEKVEGFLMTDGDLDELCEAVLSDLASTPKKVAITGASW